ncbi:hypothetical protein T05_11888 [Trichinella murrelli]|uniref:Uncharacterized protein n=1 Tax=Trichinella murrelli TaxID=144512 RepID=A0A0V0T9V5_9BILA|nr:hypothetical protein T05_11888 [Trichinella murrelli]
MFIAIIMNTLFELLLIYLNSQYCQTCLKFFKLEWLIYNVLCCVREVTFPKVSIQSSAKSAVYKMWQFTFRFRNIHVNRKEKIMEEKWFEFSNRCMFTFKKKKAMHGKFVHNYEEEMKDDESRISYFSCKPSATV